VTPDFSVICQDLQKQRHRDTDGNSKNLCSTDFKERVSAQLDANFDLEAKELLKTRFSFLKY
jgi:hypothetical protein